MWPGMPQPLRMQSKAQRASRRSEPGLGSGGSIRKMEDIVESYHPMYLLVSLTPTNASSVLVSIGRSGSWVPAPPVTASKSKLRYRSPHVFSPAGASNLLAWFEDRICFERLSPSQAMARHTRRITPHRSIRRCFVPRHAASVAPPICPDDCGAALYVSPPP